MRIHGLPGRRPDTQAWMGRVLQALPFPADARSVQAYRCWSAPGAELSFDEEAALLLAARADLLVAKSIGTRIALRASHATDFAARAAIFIGTPIDSFPPPARATLAAFASARPVLFVQQAQDVTGRAEALRAALAGAARASLVEIPGSDHAYSDVTLLATIADAWWRAAGASAFA
jgi:hypothetical protein